MKICVVGCERSGTTAISKLLSIGSGLSLLDDPPESWYVYPLIYMTGCGMTLPLWWKLRTYSIVKVPGFATILPYLRTRFVGKFYTIYCVRDPRDVVAAVFERLKNSYSSLFTDVTWMGIRVKNQVEALAWRWRKYLESTMLYEKKYNRVLYIKYENFFVDKLGVLTKCAKETGIQFNPDKAKPYLDIQLNKSWDNEIKGLNRWQSDLTQEYIDLIVEICEDLMHYWNYEI